MVNDLQISEQTYCIPTNENITPTEDVDEPMVKSDRNQSHENVDQSTDPIIPQLSGIVADLDNEFTDILDRPDRNEIIRGLTAAVLVQEMTRMTVTKIRMAVGSRRSINKAQLHSDWLTLCRHYAGGRHETILDDGVTQLEKLPPEEAQETIHSIRQAIEPDLNWAMEQKVVKIGFDVPLVGKIGIGKFSLNLSGTRAAMLTLRGRLIRLLVQSVLWISVVLGTLHWLVWILFNELFLQLILKAWRNSLISPYSYQPPLWFGYSLEIHLRSLGQNIVESCGLCGEFRRGVLLLLVGVICSRGFFSVYR